MARKVFFLLLSLSLFAAQGFAAEAPIPKPGIASQLQPIDTQFFAFMIFSKQGTAEPVILADGVLLREVFPGGVTAYSGLIRIWGERKFTGKDYDAEIGLYYFNARWYDPELGRFVSSDPIKDGVNWYVYCSNRPLVLFDPFGLDTWAVYASSDGGETFQTTGEYRSDLTLTPYPNLATAQAVDNQTSVVQSMPENVQPLAAHMVDLWAQRGSTDNLNVLDKAFDELQNNNGVISQDTRKDMVLDPDISEYLYHYAQHGDDPVVGESVTSPTNELGSTAFSRSTARATEANANRGPQVKEVEPRVRGNGKVQTTAPATKTERTGNVVFIDPVTGKEINTEAKDPSKMTCGTIDASTLEDYQMAKEAMTKYETDEMRQNADNALHATLLMIGAIKKKADK